MKRILLLALAALSAAAILPAQPAPPEEVVVLDTSLGTMVFHLLEKDAPQTVANFKKLVQEGFYDGKPFYRVVKGHVIQTGDSGESGRPAIKDEFNSNPHVAGALGLAHGPEPNSGSTEIYVCLAPRTHLDGKFTVFGQIVEGMDVLEKIGNVPVNEKFLEGNIAFHEPKEPVIIRKARLETRP
ncbi:MAG TPA: peptidylprolyl isomerase [Thermoanaerobaculia bacterium]|nr:peptidylprolyl isomerase [Thermoanaerobaculia bacterium]